MLIYGKGLEVINVEKLLALYGYDYVLFVKNKSPNNKILKLTIDLN